MEWPQKQSYLNKELEDSDQLKRALINDDKYKRF